MKSAPIQTGDPAPDFELSSLSGRVYSARDLRGHTTHLLLLRHLG